MQTTMIAQDSRDFAIVALEYRTLLPYGRARLFGTRRALSRRIGLDTTLPERLVGAPLGVLMVRGVRQGV